jgi:GT2 family glycosyltransferase
MKPITFCIATAKNEREYTKLLLRSLKEHTQIDQHEILIFIDSDNQNTYEALLEIKKEMPMIRLYRNTGTFPIGSQRNVSIMFNAAKNDIVCYLQSDMVVGKEFDKHLVASIERGVVLSCARIEPPLHPASPEKIVMDFGITPEEFRYEEFNKFVESLQKEKRPDMEGHFAPFAVYKKDWFDLLGGFDTQFRSSREDSDTIIRMRMNNLKLVQTWNACVYHFTCVSSRGKDWYKTDQEAKYKNELQQHADMQELKRFIRKWGYFGHYPKPVYDITFNIELDQYVDFNLLKHLEPYCKTLYLSDANVAKHLKDQVEFEAHYYNNLRWNFTPEHWDKVKYLFNPTDFAERIRSEEEASGDVVVSFKYSELKQSLDANLQNVISNLNSIVHDTEVGTFMYGPLTIDIRQKVNLADTYKKVKNADLLLVDQEFTFS